MELSDFVRRALTELVTAIREARTSVESVDDGAAVAPRIHHAADRAMQVERDDGGGFAFPVEFDLSVTVTESQEEKVGGGAKVSMLAIAVAGASASDTSTEGRTAIQRLKFVVPVRYPHGKPPPRTHAQARPPQGSWMS